MKLRVARQPFVPAFLTLLLVCVIALWGVPSAENSTEKTVVHVSDMVGSGVALSMPGELLLQFRYAWPGCARWLALLAALLTGIFVGRVSVRTNLYGVNSCLSLTLFFATFLLAFSVKQFCAAFRNGYSFDILFRASFCLGLLVLIRPVALPLLLLLPFGVLLFRRTQRETVVALAGLLLAPFVLCYVNWCLGGMFVAPLIAVWNEFLGGIVCSLFRSGMTPWLWVAVGFLWLNLCGIGSISAHFYSVGARARYIHIYIIGVFLLCAATLCGPAATTGDAALLAVPSAILLPFFFVRMFSTFATLLYLAVLAAAMVVLYLPVL